MIAPLLAILSLMQSPVPPAPTWSSDLLRSALTKPQAYSLLTELTTIGGRPAGSEPAARAVVWAKQTMERLGFQKVRLEPVKVAHWQRGRHERAEIVGADRREPLAVCALGPSVPTPKGGVTAGVVEVHSLAEAEALGDRGRGKIIFYNRPMDPAQTMTFRAYGGAVDQRGGGAISAAKVGAVAVLVRSMTLAHDDVPHTGHMSYDTAVPKIPAAALSTMAADRLSERLKTDADLQVRLELDCKPMPDVETANVVGEMPGSDRANEIVLAGGHLDSWDLGQGAHDDGAGCVQAMEALRLLKESGFRPRRTLRVVLFMDEENGGAGAEAYSAAHRSEKHFAAIESDEGGFMPRAITTNARDALLNRIKSWQPLLEETGIERFAPGGGGADVGPLAAQDAVLFGLRPDDQRYFDYHHSRMDRLEMVNPRELEMGAAAIAILMRLLSDEAP